MSGRSRLLPIRPPARLAGCGRPRTRSPPEVGSPEDAPRVFALALDLEAGRKTKQAVAAYRQVVQYFPGTPEAKPGRRARISEVERAAVRKTRDPKAQMT